MAKKRFGYGDFFCWHCGEKIEKHKQKCPHCQASYTSLEGVEGLVKGGIGFCEDTNHPSFKRYYKNYRKISLIWLIGLSIIVPSILLLSKQLEANSDDLKIMAVIVAIFWAFGLPFIYRRNKKDWQGVVESKRIKDDDEDRIYTVNIRKDNGKRYRIKEINRKVRFDYFNEGDRVYAHQKKYIRYLEKYDKTQDEFIPCSACHSLRSPYENFCGRCGTKLLKGK